MWFKDSGLERVKAGSDPVKILMNDPRRVWKRKAVLYLLQRNKERNSRNWISNVT